MKTAALLGTLGVIWFVRASAPRGIIDCMGRGPFIVRRSLSFSDLSCIPFVDFLFMPAGPFSLCLSCYLAYLCREK